ncbi:MAG: hypothetical protein ACLTS6_01945 [Anaerobutyricum sp.]
MITHIQRILSREEFEALFEDAFELQLEETTLVPVNLQSWMDLTSTPEGYSKERPIEMEMEYDLNGAEIKREFNPLYQGGTNIYFDHRWLLLIGKRKTNPHLSRKETFSLYISFKRYMIKKNGRRYLNEIT